MNKPIKKIIATLATITILLLMYFGAYLPLKKGQLYIKAMTALQTKDIHSVQDFIGLFSPSLNFYSPIGQDEVVSYYTGGILANVLSQQNNPQVTEILIKETEKWMEPIIKSQKGFGISQNLYNFAQLYLLAAQKLKNADYLQKSIDIFNEGLKNSPNRYIFLEGLFNDYQMGGAKEKMKEIGEIILKYWPDNEKVKTIIQSL